MTENKVTPIREEVTVEEPVQEEVEIPDFVKVPVDLVERIVNHEATSNRVILKTDCQELRVLWQDQILKPDPLQVNFPNVPDIVKPFS